MDIQLRQFVIEPKADKRRALIDEIYKFYHLTPKQASALAGLIHTKGLQFVEQKFREISKENSSWMYLVGAISKQAIIWRE